MFIGHEFNTKLVADKIFQNEELREKVNKLMHPIVRKDFDDWATNQHSELVFNEAAILFETGAYKNFDASILVCAPMEFKIKRVMNRENCSREDVLTRMSNQWSDEEKMKLADFVLENDENSQILIRIEAILSMLVNNFN